MIETYYYYFYYYCETEILNWEKKTANIFETDFMLKKSQTLKSRLAISNRILAFSNLICENCLPEN